ncbi:hypothetical protein DUI87_03529 [Hirundo rustica rustica]|uniref:Uncharacterized protein n=1 Tax=Hirundo rustica rustica TaxID=333673 RepID=A0A3M0L1Q0_HIRRU|nr:hypothetical protein DUI87_03529 [Hirundo rustica rustica]
MGSRGQASDTQTRTHILSVLGEGSFVAFVEPKEIEFQDKDKKLGNHKSDGVRLLVLHGTLSRSHTLNLRVLQNPPELCQAGAVTTSLKSVLQCPTSPSPLGEELSPDTQPKYPLTQLQAMPLGPVSGYQREDISVCPSSSLLVRKLYTAVRLLKIASDVEVILRTSVIQAVHTDSDKIGQVEVSKVQSFHTDVLRFGKTFNFKTAVMIQAKDKSGPVSSLSQ